jgi:hypothetical protein
MNMVLKLWMPCHLIPRISQVKNRSVDWLTRQALEKQDFIYVSRFETLYVSRYGEEVPVREKETLLALLKEAEASRYCCLEQQDDGSAWIIKKSPSNAFFNNVKQLLSSEESDGRPAINIAQLKNLYKARCGKTIVLQSGQRLMDHLRLAELKGCCKLRKKEGSWIIEKADSGSSK